MFIALEKIWGSERMACSMYGRLPGTVWDMVYARLEMRCLVLFLDGSVPRKKKEAKRSCCCLDHSAIDLAIQDFPEPARPENHIIGVSCCTFPSIHFLSWSKFAAWVCG